VNAIFEEERKRLAEVQAARQAKVARLQYMEDRADQRLADLRGERESEAIKWGVGGLVLGSLLAVLVGR
jgi:hypothetical protein